MAKSDIPSAARSLLSSEDEELIEHSRQQLLAAGDTCVAPIIHSLIERIRNLPAKAMSSADVKNSIEMSRDMLDVQSGDPMEEMFKRRADGTRDDAASYDEPGFSRSQLRECALITERAAGVLQALGNPAIDRLFLILNKGKPKEMVVASALVLSKYRVIPRSLVFTIATSAAYNRNFHNDLYLLLTMGLLTLALARSGDELAASVLSELFSAYKRNFDIEADDSREEFTNWAFHFIRFG